MKTITKITLAIGILCLFAFAQTEKPKAAVYIKGNPEGRDALKMAVNTFLIRSQKYQMIAVDAIDVVAEEQNRQRGGSVSNDDIAELGKDAGAQYVCVVERSESDGISYVSTSMVSVQSKIAELSEMSELPRGERIINLIEKQINTMLGISTPEPEPEPTPEPTPEYATEYTPPPSPPVEPFYSASHTKPQDLTIVNKNSEPRIRLGVRLRGGSFWQNINAGSELFDKSYANYEEMGKAEKDGYSDYYIIPGLTLSIRIMDMIAIASELNYSFISNYHFWYGDGSSYKENFSKVSISYQTIEVPVLLRWLNEYLATPSGKISGYIEAGFQWGFPVSSEATVSSGSQFTGSPFKDGFSDFRVKRDNGLVFGLGVYLINFSAGLRFTYPLTKLDKYGTIDAPSIFSFVLAYDFF